MRLARPVVRILSKDHDLDRVERGGVECAEDLWRRRIDPCTGVPAFAQEGRELLHVVAQQVIADARFPGSFEFDAVVGHRSNRCGSDVSRDDTVARIFDRDACRSDKSRAH